MANLANRAGVEPGLSVLQS